MHRRQYFPEAVNNRNLLGREKMRQERNSALKRAERIEEATIARMKEQAKREAEAAREGSLFSRVKRFLTQPISFRRKA